MIVSDSNGMGAGAEPSPRQWVSGSKVGSASWTGFGTSSARKSIDPHQWDDYRKESKKVKSAVLTEADEIVNGARQDTYGHPADNHGCTAEMWTAYLNRKYDIDLDLDTRDVCWLNVLQKISRDAHLEKRDNLVDVVGYVANIEIIDDL
jgi:hypothetical protein